MDGNAFSAPLQDFIAALLFSEGRRTRLERGKVVYGAGDEANLVYGVERGMVKLYALTRAGKEVVLSFSTAGSIFGELALVDPTGRDHYAEIRERAYVRFLPVTAFSEAMREYPEVGMDLARHYGMRWKRMTRVLTDCFFRPSCGRLATMLLRLSREYGVPDGRGVVLDIRLNQEELGGLVGVSRERINACLTRLRDLGLVELKQKRLRLLDLDAMARFESRSRPKAHPRPRHSIPRWG